MAWAAPESKPERGRHSVAHPRGRNVLGDLVRREGAGEEGRLVQLAREVRDVVAAAPLLADADSVDFDDKQLASVVVHLTIDGQVAPQCRHEPSGKFGVILHLESNYSLGNTSAV